MATEIVPTPTNKNDVYDCINTTSKNLWKLRENLAQTTDKDLRAVYQERIQYYNAVLIKLVNLL